MSNQLRYETVMYIPETTDATGGGGIRIGQAIFLRIINNSNPKGKQRIKKLRIVKEKRE